MTRDQARRSTADGKWWRSMLPSNWTLYRWNYRHSAAAVTPDKSRVVELDPELLRDLIAHHSKAELNNR